MKFLLKILLLLVALSFTSCDDSFYGTDFSSSESERGGGGLVNSPLRPTKEK